MLSGLIAARYWWYASDGRVPIWIPPSTLCTNVADAHRIDRRGPQARADTCFGGQAQQATIETRHLSASSLTLVFAMAASRSLLRLITWEFPRLCRGGSKSLTFTAVVQCRSSRRRVNRHTEGNFLVDEQKKARSQGRDHAQVLQIDNLSGERGYSGCAIAHERRRDFAVCIKAHVRIRCGGRGVTRAPTATS
jgi:hypothetical protein